MAGVPASDDPESEASLRRQEGDTLVVVEAVKYRGVEDREAGTWEKEEKSWTARVEAGMSFSVRTDFLCTTQGKAGEARVLGSCLPLKSYQLVTMS